MGCALLQDFVELAKWEDRGYHALKQSTEKAQRQLHKLQRQAAAVLIQPSAAVLAEAAKAMGMADLTAPDDVSPDTAKRPRKNAPATPPRALELSTQAAQERQHWRSFCAAVTGAAWPAALAAAPAPDAPALQDSAPLYHQRIPQLVQRLQGILEAGLQGMSGAAEGAGALDSLAGEIAQRALELRGLSDKGARARKKKALVDLLAALQAAGLSRQRSAVPATERSVHSWFAQPTPDAAMASLLEAGAAAGKAALPEASLTQAAALWSKAGAHFFRNVARMQRLWQVRSNLLLCSFCSGKFPGLMAAVAIAWLMVWEKSWVDWLWCEGAQPGMESALSREDIFAVVLQAAQAPSKDLSAREVTAAERLSEHALFLQRRQRAFLRRLGSTATRAHSLADILAAFGDSSNEELPGVSAVPPQAAFRAWSQRQAEQLDDLEALVGGTVQLLEAFSAVESAPRPNKQFKDAAGYLQRSHADIAACKHSLQSVLGHFSTSHILNPADARAVMHNQAVSCHALQRVSENFLCLL